MGPRSGRQLGGDVVRRRGAARRRGRSGWWTVEEADPSGWIEMSGGEAAAYVTPSRTVATWAAGQLEAGREARQIVGAVIRRPARRRARRGGA